MKVVSSESKSQQTPSTKPTARIKPFNDEESEEESDGEAEEDPEEINENESMK